MTFSSLFISHGSPMLAVLDSPARTFLQGLGRELGKPKAILVLSAHWDGRNTFRVNTTATPATIHDFGGFPDRLYQIQYPAPGAPALAEQAIAALQAHGLPVLPAPEHGLDHGAWVPLSLMIPQADIPVVQISLATQLDAGEHFRLGEALKSFRQRDILILASGSATHNLGALDMQADASQVPDWVRQFIEWTERQITEGNVDNLVHFYERGPYAQQNHPTPEHFLPLLVALGACDKHQGRTLHNSIEYGVLSMAAYGFTES